MACKICNFAYCVCEQGWEYFDQYLEDYYKSPNKGKNILSPLFISTMTINTKLPFMDIDCERIISEFKPTSIFRHIKKGGATKVRKKNDKVKSNNYNLTHNTLFLTSWLPYKNPLELDSKNEYYSISKCQIFKTGCFTITGLKSIKQITLYLKTLFDWIIQNKFYIPRKYEEVINPTKIVIKFRTISTNVEINNPQMVLIDRSKLNKILSIMVYTDNKEKWYTNIKGIDLEGGTRTIKSPKDPFRLVCTKISMLNMDFKLTVQIKQDVLSKLLSSNYYSIWNEDRTNLKPVNQRGPLNVVTFERDSTNRAVTITFVPDSKKVIYDKRINKFPRQVSIKGYKSGSFVLGGTKKIEDAFEVYNFIVPFINDNFKDVTMFSSEKKKFSRKIYTYEQLLKIETLEN